MPLFPISLGCYLVSVYHARGRGSSQGIDRASHAPSASVQDMSVNHRGLDVFMTKQLLNGPDIPCLCRARHGRQVSVFQEMHGPAEGGINSGMAERVAGGMLGEPRRGGCGLDDPLEE